jgi:hypothetical protein
MRWALSTCSTVCSRDGGHALQAFPIGAAWAIVICGVSYFVSAGFCMHVSLGSN